MKATKITLIAIAILIIGACGSSKKIATTTTTKPADGIYAPGSEELTAIQAQYKDVTLEQLQEGHTIYTTGACIKCHGAKNIYKREEAKWKDIIEDMAKKAKISDVQKDAVYKYVLAIKATQQSSAH